MRIFVFIIGFLFFSSAATLAAERVVLPEGESLNCTMRVNTHRVILELDDYGQPKIFRASNIKEKYNDWAATIDTRKRISSYASSSHGIVNTSGLIERFIVSEDQSLSYFWVYEIMYNASSYIPLNEMENTHPTKYLTIYKNNQEHYFVNTTLGLESYTDFCVLKSY